MTKITKVVIAATSIVCFATGAFAVGPITFNPADYDNTANTVIAGPTTVYNQGTGSFRDTIWWSLNNGQPRVGSGDYINQGKNLVMVGISATNNNTGLYNALNFTGPAVSGGQSYMTVYDTTPGDGTATKNLFDASSQTLTLSADVMFTVHSVSAGVMAFYNEGQDGLGLLASNGGGNNPDSPKLSVVFQSAGQGITLAVTNLVGSTITITNWYRVTMNLSVTGDTFTMNGTFQNHLDPLNPGSGLDGIFATLSYSGSLTNADPSALVLSNPGEVGLMAMANEGISLPDNVGVSFTNFEIVPEPSSFALIALGLGGLLTVVSRRKRA